MIYSIEVDETKQRDFLELIQALKRLGVVTDFNSVGSLAREGTSIPSHQLMDILEQSRQEIRVGKSLTLSEVKKEVASWKRK